MIGRLAGRGDISDCILEEFAYGNVCPQAQCFTKDFEYGRDDYAEEAQSYCDKLKQDSDPIYKRLKTA